ncbi:MAG: hypothetical protein VW618_02215 [Alphaproteobacteria bacterium]
MTEQPGPARPDGTTTTVELTPPDIFLYRAGDSGIPSGSGQAAVRLGRLRGFKDDVC